MWRIAFFSLAFLVPSFSHAFSLIQSKYPLTSLYATALVGEQFNESKSNGSAASEYIAAGFWPRVLAAHQRAISGQYYAYKSRNPRATRDDLFDSLGFGSESIREKSKRDFYIRHERSDRVYRGDGPVTNSKRCAPVLNTSCTLNFRVARDRYDIELKRYEQLKANATSAAASAQAKITLDLAQAQLNQATRAYQACLKTQGERAGGADLQKECVQAGVDNGFAPLPGEIRFDEDAYNEHRFLVKRSRAIRLLIDEFNSSLLSDVDFLKILELTARSLALCESYLDASQKKGGPIPPGSVSSLPTSLLPQRPTPSMTRQFVKSPSPVEVLTSQPQRLARRNLWRFTFQDYTRV